MDFFTCKITSFKNYKAMFYSLFLIPYINLQISLLFIFLSIATL